MGVFPQISHGVAVGCGWRRARRSPQPLRHPMSSSSRSTHGSGMDGSKRSSLAVAHLPDDALEGILSRLHAKSLCRSKCVSKPWRDLIADRLCCKDLPQSLQGFLYFDKGSRCGGGGGDGNDHASGDDEMLLRHGHGRFIDMLGKPVPLLDPAFAFMKERPGVKAIALLDSCNGLLLFGHRRVSDTYDSLGYIVCNPVTEQWVAVPSSGRTPTPPEEVNEDGWEKDVCTFLIFDPPASSHFYLVQFWRDGWDGFHEVEWVHTYSSITGLWSDRSSEWRRWGQGNAYMKSPVCGKAVVNGMLHILIHALQLETFVIVAVDSQGRVCRLIEWPDQRVYPYVGFNDQSQGRSFVFIGQSQGRLHCIGTFDEGSGSKSYGLSIWVLEDYSTEEWVLKHRLSLRHLFEGVGPIDFCYYSFVGLHTDRNVMFFVHCEDRKLISYDMDSREVRVLCTLTPGHGSPYVTPYVPSLESLSTTTTTTT